MTAEVMVPTIMRDAVNSHARIRVGGEDVADVLAAIGREYPNLLPRLVNGSGELHRFINVYVDGVDIRSLGGTKARVAEGAAISIIPAVAGG